MPRHLLILNPNAGQGRQRDALAQALDARPWMNVHPSQSPEDTRRTARNAVAEGVDVIAVGGGDGTVHDVVSAVAAKPPPAVAVVPLGTANDLAKTLGVPLDDPGAALDLARDGKPTGVDLACVSGGDDRRWMVNAASAGFSEQVEAVIDDELKRKWRGMAYVRAALEVLTNLESVSLTVEVDGRVANLQACALLVANGQYAGGMRFAPISDASDRLLDVLVVTALGAAQQARLGVELALGRHLGSPHLWAIRADKVRIDASPPLTFRIDGETVGRTPAVFEIVPQAIRVMAP